MVVVNETTEKVRADEIRARADIQQRQTLDQMPGFTAVLTGPDHVFAYVNEAYRRIGGDREYIGLTVREVFPDLADQEFFELLDKVYASGERFVASGLPLKLAQNSELSFIELLYEPIRSENGEVIGIFVGGYDSTEIHNAVTTLADRESFLSSVLQSSTDCIKVLDLEGRLAFMNEGGRKVMEINEFATVADCPWDSFFEGAAKQSALDAIAAARAVKASHFLAAADTAKGNRKWWDISVAPIPGPDGSPARILSVSRDTSELAAAQEQLRLQNGELGHRFKNMLTMVQAIAPQTFLMANSVEEGAQNFAARLTAFGKASEVLTASEWKRARLDEIIMSGLGVADSFRDRIDIDGPEVSLPGQAALALTLALHELATNALKYGALSDENGRVEIKWSQSTERERSVFHFEWKEIGGPLVAQPAHRGFGSRMIKRSLGA